MWPKGWLYAKVWIVPYSFSWTGQCRAITGNKNHHGNRSCFRFAYTHQERSSGFSRPGFDSVFKMKLAMANVLKDAGYLAEVERKKFVLAVKRLNMSIFYWLWNIWMAKKQFRIWKLLASHPDGFILRPKKLDPFILVTVWLLFQRLKAWWTPKMRRNESLAVNWSVRYGKTSRSRSYACLWQAETDGTG